MFLVHVTIGGLGAALDRAMQRGVARAYGSVGAGRFKEGTRVLVIPNRVLLPC